MLSPNMIVAQRPGLVDGDLNDSLRSRCQMYLTLDGPPAATFNRLNGLSHMLKPDAQVIESFCCRALFFPNKPKQEVLRPDVVVVKAQRLFLRQRQHPPRGLGELIEAVGHGA